MSNDSWCNIHYVILEYYCFHLLLIFKQHKKHHLLLRTHCGLFINLFLSNDVNIFNTYLKFIGWFVQIIVNIAIIPYLDISTNLFLTELL